MGEVLHHHVRDLGREKHAARRERLDLAARERHPLGERQMEFGILDRAAAGAAVGETFVAARQPGDQHFADRRQIVRGDPAPERQQMRRQRGVLENGRDIAQFVTVGSVIAERDDDAATWTSAERDLDLGTRSHARGERIRDAIGEGLSHRKWERDVGDDHGRGAYRSPAPAGEGGKQIAGGGVRPACAERSPGRESR